MAARKKHTEATGSVVPTGSVAPTGSVEPTGSLSAKAEDDKPVFTTPVKYDPNVIQARMKIVCTNLSCAFDGEASTGAPSCFIKSHKWNINGTELGGSIVFHTFDKPGTYSVTLTVQDSCKNTTTISEQLTVG
jgi:hypothetical protein